MKINELITKLETMQAVWGNIGVYFNSGEDGPKRVDSVHVSIVPVEHEYILVMDEIKPSEESYSKNERLMNGLMKCSGIEAQDQDVCQGCPYVTDQDCTGKLAYDALARIRELETK